MPLFDHFGFIAPVYEKYIRLRDPEPILDHVDLPIEGALLDVGGGTGRVTQALVGLVPTIIIVDLSLEMLTQAQKKDNLRPVCSHSEKLPFPDDSFERVIMVDALHHVCDGKKSLAELWRVLKPGGRLVVEEPDIRRWSVKMLALAEKIALMRSHFISPERIRGSFSDPRAHVKIFASDFNAWVVVDKAKE